MKKTKVGVSSWFLSLMLLAKAFWIPAPQTPQRYTGGRWDTSQWLINKGRSQIFVNGTSQQWVSRFICFSP